MRVDGAVLRPVRPLPARLDAMCGWYDGDGRQLLLSQFAEAYFGEPMVLVAEGVHVRRAYPISDTEMIAEDGTEITLGVGHLTLTTGGSATTLVRTERFREHEVTFTTGDINLAGTVVIPAGLGPHPAAVVVHGAAGGQRDFCRLLVTPLLEAGVAVLIYDKAGHGRSDGKPPSIVDQANAAQAGFDLLAAMPGIDVRRRGLVGFSNGMWSVPMVAARRPEVAFIAGIGSPGVSIGAAETHRRTKVLRDAGVGAETLAAVGEAWRCIFAIVGAGATTDELTERLTSALHSIDAAQDLSRYEIPVYVQENPMLSPIPPPIPVDELVALLAAEHDPHVVYDPALDYRGKRCPILLQYGAHDTSVPVQPSIDQIRAAAPKATIIVYPDLEHMLNIVPDGLTGLTQEAAMCGFHRFEFGAEAGPDLTAWLRATVMSH
jgi:pimeloyl-ACP methyl ester carboxylesterase